MNRLTERRGDGVRYTSGRYEITCYPKNDNLSDIDKIAVRLCELEDKLESGELQELNNKPLTLEELKHLDKGDWVWFIDKVIAPNTGYYWIKSINVSHILLEQGLRQILVPYALYDIEWLVYKNKEAADDGLNQNKEQPLTSGEIKAGRTRTEELWQK